MAATELAPPSPFLLGHLEALTGAARLGAIADLACGRGRHALALAERGLRVAALDRSRPHLAELRRRAAARRVAVAVVRADLERHEIPLRAASCGAILVFRFLFRPLARAIQASLAPGGVLLYETFSEDQRRLGWGPSNPDYLLRPGELPALFPGLEVLEAWEGISPGPRPEAVGRLLARRPPR